MFGIDDIGLLLAAISLLEAVVHDIKKVAGRIRSFTSYEEERLKLITKICSQRCILNLAVTKLLAPLLRQDEIDALCEATSPLIWANPQLTTRLQQRYSQDLLTVFENARLAIARSSYKFLRSIGVSTIHELDAAGLSPLHVLERAKAEFDRGLGARLRYASHSKSIQEYFESIRDANQDIHNAMSSISDHVTQSRQASKDWLQLVKQTRQSAIRLHEALSQHSVQCSHQSHRQTVYLALSSSGNWSEPRPEHSASIGAAQRFDLLLEAPAQLTPARVLICSSNSVALPHDMTAVQIRTGACMLADNGLPLPVIRRGFRANINDDAVSAIVVQAAAPGTSHVRSQAQACLPSNRVTLLSLLPRRDRLPDVSRVTVASNIADSVAHLAGTPWLTPDVSKRDIVFFEKPDPSSSRGSAFAEAYLGRNVHRSQLPQHPPGDFSSTYYQTMTLKMSMWFLELCAANDRGHDSNPQQSLAAILANAFTWHAELCKSQTDVVLEAALGCLKLAVDSRLSFTDQDKDLEVFRSTVMEPLRDADRSLHPVR
ncbi:hypothetical protein LTR95_006959 [Oleoguttula sp. CCFEE 5521]